jgi:hypothetical protein
MRIFFAAAILTALTTLTGCVSTQQPGSFGQPSDAGGPAVENPPPAAHNLTGFNAAYRVGYNEGCNSAKAGNQQRDETRFRKDADYRLGWQDGLSICMQQFKKP